MKNLIWYLWERQKKIWKASNIIAVVLMVAGMIVSTYFDPITGLLIGFVVCVLIPAVFLALVLTALIEINIYGGKHLFYDRRMFRCGEKAGSSSSGYINLFDWRRGA